MRIGSLLRGLVIACALACALIVPLRARGRNEDEPTYRVLFIGNSYTRANDLPRTVRDIARAVPDGPRVAVETVANPGWDLERHWAISSTRARIEAGGLTHVVLQGHSLTAVEHRDQFEGTVRRFHEMIRRAGARTVLYETWARRFGSSHYRGEDNCDDPIVMQVQITDCYVQVGREIDADVAPAGRAFMLAQQRMLSRADLFRSDGAHPNRNGTYLAASVLYSVITRQDPRRSTWRPHRMTRRMWLDLRDIAWASVSAPAATAGAL